MENEEEMKVYNARSVIVIRVGPSVTGYPIVLTLAVFMFCSVYGIIYPVQVSRLQLFVHLNYFVIVMCQS